MSQDDRQPVDEAVPADAAGGAGAAPGAGARAGEPSEAELRAAYEAELSRLTSIDVMAQAVVSLLNVGARRLTPSGDPQGAGAAGATPPERDLEQARDAIDAVRALLEILERRIPRELKPLRDALSRLQMAYAQEVGPSGAAQPPGADTQMPGAGAQPPGADTQPPGAGAQPPGADTQPPGAGGQRAPAGAPRNPDTGHAQPGPGPAESSGRLWVPGR